jgi:hypothetical protein
MVKPCVVHHCRNQALPGKSRCQAHQREYWRNAKDSPTTRQCSTAEHKRARAKAVARGFPQPCCLCGFPIMSASSMHMHHVVKGGSVVKPAHVACNLRAQ